MPDAPFPRFAVPTSPLPNEGFAEFFARACNRNGYLRPWSIWKWLFELRGRSYTINHSALQISDQNLSRLAHFLGADPHHLEVLRTTGSSRAMINFRGIDFRRAMIDAHHRRVSPIALEQENCLKFIWRVKPLQFDPHTREYLLSVCPVCDKRFKHHLSIGPRYCDRCFDTSKWPIYRVDLRDFPQAKFETDDGEALNWFASLLTPDDVIWKKGLNDCPPELERLRRGQLVELILSLAAMSDRYGSPFNVNFQSRQVAISKSEIASTCVVEAVRLIISWRKLAPMYIEYFCRSADLGHHVMRLLRGKGIAGDFIKTIGAAHKMQKDQDRERIKIQIIHPAGEFSSSYFDKKMNHVVNASSLGIVRSFSNRMGLPSSVVAQMCHDGLLPSNMFSTDVSDDCTLSSFERFYDDVRRISKPSTGSKSEIRLTYVVHCLTLRPEACWSSIFRGILAGRIELYYLPRYASLLNNLCVSDYTSVYNAIFTRSIMLPGLDTIELSYRDAQGYLRMTRNDFQGLRDSGRISLPVTANSIYEFRSKFIGSGEIAYRAWMKVRAGSYRGIVKKLRAAETKSFKIGETTYYDRDEAERLFDGELFPRWS